MIENSEHPSSIEYAIESTRSQFSPESQNIIAGLIAALEPISVELLAELSSNSDGKSFGNVVEVTPAQAEIVIKIFERAEQQFGAELLEVGTTSDNSGRKTYKFTEKVQSYIKEKYPQLFKNTHKMIADRLWDSLFGDDADKPDSASTSQTQYLIPTTKQIGQLADDAAKETASNLAK